MSATEVKGLRFWEVDLSTADDVYIMSESKIINNVRLTGIETSDFMEFFEADDDGNYPRVFKLDQNTPVASLDRGGPTKIGFDWANCSITHPTSAILSIEIDQ